MSQILLSFIKKPHTHNLLEQFSQFPVGSSPFENVQYLQNDFIDLENEIKLSGVALTDAQQDAVTKVSFAFNLIREMAVRKVPSTGIYFEEKMHLAQNLRTEYLNLMDVFEEEPRFLQL